MKKLTAILILALLLTVALTLTACDELCSHNVVIDEAVPATCTEGGFTEGKYCSKCFKGFVAQEKIPALGHTEVVDEAVPATCTATGLTEGKHCATCGEILVEQQVIDMCAHTEEIIPAVPSTCTETGLTEGKRCTVCGKTTVEQQVVGMHNIVAGQARPATCTTAGLTAGKYCNVCGETIEVQQVIPALGHTEEILSAVPATCTTSGLTEGKHCTVCNVILKAQEEIPATHIEIDHEAKEPTCTEVGWDAYVTCSRCDYTTYVEKAALSHNIVNHKAQAPTCSEIGWDAYVTCSRCDYTTYVEKAALSHNIVNHKAQAPTCTEIGWDAYVTCSRCDYNTYVEKKAIGHNIVNHAGKVPTCTEIGWDAYVTCSRCNYNTYAQKNALGHNMEVVEKGIAPTCTTGGYTDSKACSRCDYNIAAHSLTSLGHDNNKNGVCIRCDFNFLTYELLVDDDGGEYYVVVEAHRHISGDIVIPSTHNGKPVTAIGDRVFVDLSSLTSITIPNSVTTIGEYAFSTCRNLTTVIFEENSQLTTIDVGAFHLCDDLTSITIPNSVTTIGERAFKYCQNLTTVIFEENSRLTTIGEGAFYECWDLTSINIPNSITVIGDYAFRFCHRLTFNSYDNGKYIGNDTNPYLVLVEATSTSITTCEINENCKIINSYAFSGCDKLISVTIGDSVSIIGKNAFDKCYALVEVYNYSSLNITKGSSDHGFVASNAIDVYTTDEPSKLTFDNGFAIHSNGTLVKFIGTAGEVVIPEGVTTIGERAFYDRYDLTSITIPASVTTMGKYAFHGCTGIKDMYYLGTLEQWCGITFDVDDVYSELEAKNMYIDGELIIGELVIPNTVTEIKAFAFYTCQSLTSITIPNSVTTIGKYAFASCRGLTTVIFEENSQLTTIDRSAFSNCQSLTSITIPNSVTTIDNYAFNDCDSLTSVTFEENSQLTTIGEWAFYDCDSLTSIIIPDGVTTIGERAFYACGKLTSVTIGNSVTTIGEYAFYGCYCLAEVYNHSSLEITKGSSSYGYVAEYALDVYTTNEPSKLTTDENGFVIHTNGNVKTLVRYKGTATEITIPDSVTTIGSGAFYNCDSLTSVTFKGNSQLTTIGECAFYDCDSLTSVTFEENSQLTTIGGWAFYDCDSLTSIIIPDGVTSISRSAFSRCDSLTSITIPDSLTTIDNYAFYECDRLTDVYFTGTEEEWNAIVIASDNDVLSTATIHFIITLDAVAPTCTETGLTEGKCCSTCDKVLVAQTVIPATGHDLDENDVCIHGDYAVGVTYRLLGNGMDYALVKVDTNVSGDFVVPNKFNGKPVTMIDNRAFSGCVNLTSIKIEEGYYNLTIGSSAFANCARLKTIEIPSNVTKIEDDAFHNCPSLTDIYYYGSEDRWDDVYDVIYWPSAGIGTDLKNVKIHFIITLDAVAPTCTKTGLTEGKYCETCKKTVVAQESIDALGHDYDSNGNCLVCEDPESRYTLTEDGTGYILERIANKNLAGIYVMENKYNNKPITVIGRYAFDMCAQLESVVISDSVTTIEEMAFAGCTSLTSVVISKNVTSIGAGVFSLCDNLTDIYFTGTEAEWKALIAKSPLALAGAPDVTIHFNYVPEQN